MPCKTLSASHPASADLPKLPETTYRYNVLGEPVERMERVVTPSGTKTRTTTTTYDSAGREIESAVAGDHGDPVPRITTSYDPGTGRETRTTNAAAEPGGTTRSITKAYDSLGRVTRYEDADGGVATFEYDALDRPTRTRYADGVQAPFAEQLLRYDPLTGRIAERSDTDLGDVRAEYYDDDEIVAETFVKSGLKLEVGYGETGAAVRRRYVKTTDCVTACVWHDSQARESIHGQWLEHVGSDGTQRYVYDAAGRLTRTDDAPAGQACVVRTYAYDADSNRVAQSTRTPTAGTACDTTAPATEEQQSYDEADRITGEGFTYDDAGRLLTVPAEAAGGAKLTATYYANDLVRSLEQGADHIEFEYDPEERIRVRTPQQGVAERNHFADETDEPAWRESNGVRTRDISDIAGELSAVVTGTRARLQLTNLHGDVVAEVDNAADARPPATSLATDEFGVPRPKTAPKIKVVGSNSTALTNGATSMTISVPAGTQAGDLLWAEIASSSSATITPPAGWNSVMGGQVANGSSRYAVYWRVAATSEPASHGFTFSSSGRHRGGIKTLRNANTDAPVDKIATATGTTSNISAPAVTPSLNDVAISRFVGNDRGDGNDGGSWAFPTPLIEDWDVSTGDRNAASATELLAGGANTSTGTRAVTNQTGASADKWAAITAAIAPAAFDSSTRRYGYVGAKQRSTALPSGVITMGARVYVPQMGRFLQPDPVYGGSANPYEYAFQDPVNVYDLDGRCPLASLSAPLWSGGRSESTADAWSRTSSRRPRRGARRSAPRTRRSEESRMTASLDSSSARSPCEPSARRSASQPSCTARSTRKAGRRSSTGPRATIWSSSIHGARSSRRAE